MLCPFVFKAQRSSIGGTFLLASYVFLRFLLLSLLELYYYGILQGFCYAYNQEISQKKYVHSFRGASY